MQAIHWYAHQAVPLEPDHGCSYCSYASLSGALQAHLGCGASWMIWSGLQTLLEVQLCCQLWMLRRAALAVSVFHHTALFDSIGMKTKKLCDYVILCSLSSTCILP